MTKSDIGKVRCRNFDILLGLENADITMIAKWWACVYRSMDELQSNEEIRTQLRDLEILPLADGSVVSLQRCSVFFPLDQEERRKKRQKGRGLLNIFCFKKVKNILIRIIALASYVCRDVESYNHSTNVTWKNLN